MDAGLTFSTTQVVAFILGGVSLIGTLAGVIHKGDRDSLRDQKESYEVRLRDQRESYERQLTEKNAEIAKMVEVRERQMILMEESVGSSRQQAKVSEAMYDRIMDALRRDGDRR